VEDLDQVTELVERPAGPRPPGRPFDRIAQATGENRRGVGWRAVRVVDAVLAESVDEVAVGLELVDQLDEVALDLAKLHPSGVAATSRASGPVGLPGARFWPAGRLS
jgi:hypothetical protein